MSRPAGYVSAQSLDFLDIDNISCPSGKRALPSFLSISADRRPVAGMSWRVLMPDALEGVSQTAKRPEICSSTASISQDACPDRRSAFGEQ